MSEPDLRIDPLTGAFVVVTPWRQHRPNRPDGQCPFCPGGLEAPHDYDARHIVNRWPALPDDRHEVVLHSPDHGGSFVTLGVPGTARVIELWSDRTAALAARDDVGYVFVFENRGPEIGATIDHPHSQIMGLGVIPPIPMAELTAPACTLCGARNDGELLVTSHANWLAAVPWAPSWPYEMLISPRGHIPDLPSAGPGQRREMAGVLVDCMSGLQRLLGERVPYMLWMHQRPTDRRQWPAAHLHLHLAPVMRAPGVRRHLASAELGAGCFFDPVDPPAAAAQLRDAIADLTRDTVLARSGWRQNGGPRQL